MLNQRQSSHLRKDRAFTLVEAIVSIIILVVLAGAMIPTISTYARGKQITAAAATLVLLDQGIDAFFIAPTTAGNWDYPGRLEDLSQPIGTGSSTLCNGVLPSNAVVLYNGTAANTATGGWKGPYVAENIPSTGLYIGIGTVNNVLVRGANNTTEGLGKMTIPSVGWFEAKDLNTELDGPNDPYNAVDSSNVTGVIRWAAPGVIGNPVDVNYMFFHRAVC